MFKATNNKNDVAELLHLILDGEGDDESVMETWNECKFEKPVNNNIIMTTPTGSQYNIQVKEVSK